MIDREQLGRLVRGLWIGWAVRQPNPKPSWLVPYDDLSEADKEADRVIGEGLMHEFFAATTGERLRVERALQVLREAQTWDWRDGGRDGGLVLQTVADGGEWVRAEVLSELQKILESTP